MAGHMDTVLSLERMYDNNDSYGGGQLTQLSHALQAATLARDHGEDDLTIVAGIFYYCDVSIKFLFDT